MDKTFIVKDDIPTTTAWTSPNEAKCAAVFSSWFPGVDFTPENLKKVPMKAIREAMTSVVVDEIDFFLREIHAIVGLPSKGRALEDLPRSSREPLKMLCRHVKYLMSKLEISKAEVKKQLVETLRVYASEESISEVIDFFFNNNLGLSTKIFQDMFRNEDKGRPKLIRSIPEEFVEPSITVPRWKASDFIVTDELISASKMSLEEIEDLVKGYGLRKGSDE